MTSPDDGPPAPPPGQAPIAFEPASFGVAARGARAARVRSLTLVFERRLFELLPSADEDTRLEASGIEIDGHHLLIVLDNLAQIARLPFRREPFEVTPGTLVGPESLGIDGFEDLVLDTEGRRLLLLREAVVQGDGTFQAEIRGVGPSIRAPAVTHAAVRVRGCEQRLRGPGPDPAHRTPVAARALRGQSLPGRQEGA